MESPLDDFPSEPIANSSGSTSDASQNRFAPIVDSITRLVGSLLHRLRGALNRAPRVEPRGLRPDASTSLADEISHIAHDAGLTQDVAVQSLQRAVAETVQREAARLSPPDHDGTPPRVFALVVAAALVAGVICGIMWQPWTATPAASVTSSVVAASAPSLLDTVPVVSVAARNAAVAEIPEVARSSNEPAQAAAIARAGRLRIVTEPPGARVTVNGIGRGVTPLTIRHLPTGAKRVRVTKDGYAGAERVVSLADNDVDRTVRIRLARMRR